MKSFAEFNESFDNKRTPVDSLWQGDNAYAAAKGFKVFAGGTGFKTANPKMDIALYYPSPGDAAFIKDALTKKLKTGEVLFRYTNPRVQAGGMMPMVKINIKRGLIYYNKPEASEEDILDFEGRGEKLRYLNLRDDFESKLKPFMHG